MPPASIARSGRSYALKVDACRWLRAWNWRSARSKQTLARVGAGMAPTRCLVSDQVPSHIRADESFVQQIHRRFAGGRYWNCPIADDLRGIHPLACRCRHPSRHCPAKRQQTGPWDWEDAGMSMLGSLKQQRSHRMDRLRRHQRPVFAGEDFIHSSFGHNQEHVVGCGAS